MSERPGVHGRPGLFELPGRSRRFTLRARLAVAYAALVSITGALMLGGVYLFMRYVPSYSLSPLQPANALTSVPSAPLSSEPLSTLPPGAVNTNVDAGFLAPVVNDTSDVFTLLLAVSIAVFVILAVIGAVAGWIIAGRMLRPLQSINRVAKVAAGGDLGQRIRSAGPRDELHELSETLDDMLARLERSVGEHQRFAANASHELRTPIATTQTLLDIALTDPDIDLPTLKVAAERVREMNQRNRETVNALLSLAEADAGALQLTSVNVDAIALEAVRSQQSTADKLELSIEAVTETAIALGDETLLRQAVANLVQNAVRHNERGGLVEVNVQRAGDVVVVRVENTGAVLREDVIATLTEPFVRAQGRVAGGRKGHGLGLALVRSVAQAHHGDLVISARDGGGLEVELRVPALVGAGSTRDTDAIGVR